MATKPGSGEESGLDLQEGSCQSGSGEESGLDLQEGSRQSGSGEENPGQEGCCQANS